ncbi:MAG: HAMP domain-containing sensor histidine kinase [Pseudomonadota bacterium]
MIRAKLKYAFMGLAIILISILMVLIAYMLIDSLRAEERAYQKSLQGYYEPLLTSLKQEVLDLLTNVDKHEKAYLKKYELDENRRFLDLPKDLKYFSSFSWDNADQNFKYTERLIALEASCDKENPSVLNAYDELINKAPSIALRAEFSWRKLLKIKKLRPKQEFKEKLISFIETFSNVLTYWSLPYSFHALELYYYEFQNDEVFKSLFYNFTNNELENTFELLIYQKPHFILKYLNNLTKLSLADSIENKKIVSWMTRVFPYYHINERISKRVSVSDYEIYHKANFINNELEYYVPVKAGSKLSVYHLDIAYIEGFINELARNDGIRFPVKIGSIYSFAKDNNNVYVLLQDNLVIYGEPLRSESAEVVQKIKTKMSITILIIVLVILLMAIVLFVLIYNLSISNKLNKAKSDFVATVSHELKTPITAVKMFTEMIQSKIVTDPVKIDGYYRSILYECDRLTRMINNLLSYANIEKGSQQYKMSEVSVNTILNTVLDIMSVTTKGKGFIVETEIEKDLPFIKADPDLLTQSFINLLSNSVKYSSDEKFIKIKAYKNEAYIFIVFKDHGIGISEREKAKVFNSFYRVLQEGDMGVVPGSGIGLYLVKQHIETHGGTVLLESEKGKGTTVTLKLPINLG